jgi:hypothetical protein
MVWLEVHVFLPMRDPTKPITTAATTKQNAFQKYLDKTVPFDIADWINMRVS